MISLFVKYFSCADQFHLVRYAEYGEHNEADVEMLQSADFTMLSTESVVEILGFLCDQHFFHYEVMNVLEDAIDRQSELKGLRYAQSLEINRLKKQEAEQAKLAAKQSSKQIKTETQRQEEESAALVARLMEIEEARGSRRQTRNATETPEERRLRLDQEAALKQQEEREERQWKIQELEQDLEAKAVEAINIKSTIRSESLGFDRNMTQYRQFATFPGLYAVDKDGKIQSIDSTDQLESLIGALNIRGIREKQLKEALTDAKERLIKEIQAANGWAVKANVTMLEADSDAAACGDEEGMKPVESPTERETLSEPTSIVMSTADNGNVGNAELRNDDFRDSQPMSANDAATAAAVTPEDALTALLDGLKAQVLVFHTSMSRKVGRNAQDSMELMHAKVLSATEAQHIAEYLIDLEGLLAPHLITKPLGKGTNIKDAVTEGTSTPVSLDRWRSYRGSVITVSQAALMYRLLHDSTSNIKVSHLKHLLVLSILICMLAFC